MDMSFRPLRWTAIEINDGNKIVHKVLAGWKKTWRLSSGITQIIDNGDHFEIHNKSGSVYECHKKDEGIDGLINVLTADSFTKLTDGIELDFISLEKRCRWED